MVSTRRSGSVSAKRSSSTEDKPPSPKRQKVLLPLPFPLSLLIFDSLCSERFGFGDFRRRSRHLASLSAIDAFRFVPIFLRSTMAVRRRNRCRRRRKIPRTYLLRSPCLIPENVAPAKLRSPARLPTMEWAPARVTLRRLCLSRRRLLMPHVSTLIFFSSNMFVFCCCIFYFFSFGIATCVVNLIRTIFFYTFVSFTLQVRRSLRGLIIRNKIRISKVRRGAGSCRSLHR